MRNYAKLYGNMRNYTKLMDGNMYSENMLALFVCVSHVVVTKITSVGWVGPNVIDGSSVE